MKRTRPPERPLRRAFSAGLLRAAAGWCLLGSLLNRDLLAGEGRSLARDWMREAHAIASELRAGALSPAEWKRRAEALFSRVDLADLLSYIRFDRLTRDLAFPESGAATRPVSFDRLPGLPENLAFFGKIFGLPKGSAIVPHGHRNMVSCHTVLGGEFRLRQFDRVRDEAAALIVRPVVDRTAGPGDASAISDAEGNVHWFDTLSETAFTLDVILTGLDPAARVPYRLDFIDPVEGEPAGEGLLRVPTLPVETALARYGRSLHH